MDEKPSIGQQAVFATLYSLIGVVYGYILWMCSLGVAGGGHGNNGAILTLPASLFAPALGIAWGFWRLRLADLILAPMIIYAFFLDFFIFSAFNFELDNRAPELYAVWYALWIGWQIPMVALLVVRISNSVRNRNFPS